MGTVSRSEWRWVAPVAAAVMLFSSLPYAAGYLAQTPHLRFIGAVADRDDYNSYLARMWQGYRGEWAGRLLFTPEEHRGSYLTSFYVVLGHLARLLGMSVPLTYHLARVGSGFVLLPTVYRFIARFAVGEVRRAAFLLAVTSSGLGWLVAAVAPTPPGGLSPIDFWLIDAYVFFSLFTFPHFAVALTLLLMLHLSLLEIVGKEEPLRLRRVVEVVVLSLTLGLIHPYDLLVADMASALYLAWRTVERRRVTWGPVLTLAVMGLTQLPLAGYDYYVISTNPVFRAWTAQNVTLSPPPWYYVTGYGPVGLLAVWGTRRALRATHRARFLLLWIAVVLVASYYPWQLQRRFLEGVLVALSVPAGYGLVEGLLPLVGRWRKYSTVLRRWTKVTVMLLASLSNLYLVASFTISAAGRHPSLFRTADEVQAAEWLATHSAWDDTVLASYESGNWLAGAIGRRVVLGHRMETVDYATKKEAVDRFFSGARDFDRCGLLKRYGVAYVFVGPREREMGGPPDGLPCLQPVLWSGPVVIYQVQIDGG